MIKQELGEEGFTSNEIARVQVDVELDGERCCKGSEDQQCHPDNWSDACTLTVGLQIAARQNRIGYSTVKLT